MPQKPTHSPAFVNLSNARVKDQRQVMESILAANECPFCSEALERYHHQPILESGQFWLVTTNQWPYDHTKHHFLFIAKTHWEHLEEITPAAGSELFSLCQKICQDYQLPGGGLVIRFGNTHYSAGTVAHLHAQLVVPEVTAPDFEPVRVKLGTKMIETKNQSAT